MREIVRRMEKGYDRNSEKREVFMPFPEYKGLQIPDPRSRLIAG